MIRIFAKLLNGALSYAPKRVTWQGRIVDNPTPAMLQELGYYPVTYTDMPGDAPEGQRYEAHWEQAEAEIIQVWVLMDDPDKPTLEEAKEQKLLEVSEACRQIIHAGVDVVLPDNTVEHFSLKEEDQINLFGKQAQLAAGVMQLEYHQDGHPCRYYTAEEMQAIITAAMQHVSYHTTYCNSLNMWIAGVITMEEMNTIFYGADVPEEYQSQVLKDYLAAIMGNTGEVENEAIS